MIEQRKNIRKSLYYNIKVFEPKTNRLLGVLTDLSISGAQMLSEIPLPPHQEVELEFENTLDIYPEKRAKVKAECCWCQDDMQNEGYDSGIRFLSLSRQADEMIRCYN